MNKAEMWFNRFCANSKAFKKLEANPDYIDLACLAATLSYRASVLRAVKFNGKKREAAFARKDGETIIEEFLCAAINEKTPFEIDVVYDIWNKIYKVYKKHGIDDYTYGNAQKWVNMSIKYYAVLLQHFNMENSLITGIPVFPVDGIMIKHIKKEFNISFNGSWSQCNDIDYLKSYIQAVKEKTEKKGMSLYDYELNAWES